MRNVSFKVDVFLFMAFGQKCDGNTANSDIARKDFFAGNLYM